MMLVSLYSDNQSLGIRTPYARSRIFVFVLDCHELIGTLFISSN